MRSFVRIAGRQPRFVDWLVCATLVVCFASFDARGDVGTTLQAAVPGLRLSDPTAVAADPRDPSIWYVLERNGVLLEIDTAVVPPAKRVALDLSDRVGTVRGEYGAQSFAFHPALDAEGVRRSPYLFILYAAAMEKGGFVRLSRFSVDRTRREIERDSERVLIHQLDRTPYHNGGGLAFGPDGLLYVGLGDDGRYWDDKHHSQKIDRSLFAGILRIDVDQKGGELSHPPPRQPRRAKTAGYFVPVDNPFVGRPNALEEFWSIGLRNPFRLSFDPITHELWVTDVGQNKYEEINIASSGSNHEWSYREGPEVIQRSYLKGKPPNPYTGTATPPVFAYDHSGERRCIVGGAVYRGKQFPELEGQFVFGDCTSGEVLAFDPKHKDRAPVVLGCSTDHDVSGITMVTQLGDDIVVSLLGPGDGTLLKLTRREPDAPACRYEDTPARRFNKLCFTCHNLRRAAGTAPDPTPRDLRDPEWQRSVTDDYIAKVIREGGEAVGLSGAMAAWGEALSAQEIAELVTFIRSIEAKSGEPQHSPEKPAAPPSLDETN